MKRNTPLRWLLLIFVLFLLVPPVTSQADSLRGRLEVSWRDEGDPVFRIIGEDGAITELQPTNVDEASKLATQLVEVTFSDEGAASISQPAQQLATIDGQAMTPFGEERFVTLMCYPKFVEPTDHTPEYFSGMYPIIGEYSRSASYGQLHISGEAAGWFPLPEDRYAYRDGWFLNTRKISQACVTSSGIDVSEYDGIIFVFPGYGGVPGEGGFWCPTYERCWRASWLPEWTWQNLSTVTHEVLHSYGIPHSHGLNGAPYGNPYDVMSDAHTCKIPHAVYGCLPQHTIAYSRMMVGWAPRDVRTVTAWAGSITKVELEAASAISDTLVMAITQSQNIEKPYAYSFEYRPLTGFDAQLPAEGIIIHRISYSGGQPTLVTNMGGQTASQVGATFRDAAADVEICVRGRTATGGYTVDIAVGTGIRCGTTIYFPLAFVNSTTSN